MVNEMLLPSILPSVMVDFPIISRSVSPESLAPSTLKLKVRSIGPFGPSAVPFHLPLISAADATIANRAIRTRSAFMRFTVSHERGRGQALRKALDTLAG